MLTELLIDIVEMDLDLIVRSNDGSGSIAQSLLMALLHIYAYFSMLSCMRTTIEITDELCRQLKRKAADEGVTIRQVVESALWVTSVNKRGAKVTRLNGKQNEAEYYPAFGSTTATPYLI